MASKKATPDSHRQVFENKVDVLGISLGVNGELFAAGFGHAPKRPHVSIWNPTTGKPQATFGIERGVVCWYAAQSSKGLVAAGFGDLTLRIWNPSTKKLNVLATLNGIVAAVAWSADGSLLLSGNCGDNTIRLWDVARGVEVAQAVTKKSGTWCVALAPDASSAVSGAGDKLVHVWDKNLKPLGSLVGHTGKILWLTFFQDGQRVASASQDKTARIWNLKSPKTSLLLAGHAKQVTWVAVSPNQKQVATCASDKTIRLWNASTGVCERVLHLENTSAVSLVYAADGSELYAGCADSWVRSFAISTAHVQTARTSVDALFEAVWADPQQDVPRALLADALTEAGDLRGEFLVHQLTRAKKKAPTKPNARERELLMKNKLEWLGPLAPYVESTHLEFERGFVSKCVLRKVRPGASNQLKTAAWCTVKEFVAPKGAPEALVRHLKSLGAVQVAE
jgi:uncharacterized protein (TIGR02996 family)